MIKEGTPSISRYELFVEMFGHCSCKPTNQDLMKVPISLKLLDESICL